MENNEVSKSNKIKIIVITALIFLVSIAGISYAYFTIQIVGNETASSMRLTTANLSLVYNDVQIVSKEYAQPGWTQTKTLTVYNDGNQTAYYNIIWRDLYNEVTNNELVISATCSSSSGSCNDISETVIPTSSTLTHNVSLKNNIEIPVGVTHTYTVTVRFKETGSNQNYNQDKEFYGTLNIGEGNEPVALKAGDEITYGSEHFYVVSTNASETVLLSKYNLLVGDTYNNSAGAYSPISKSATGYGLQSSSAKGSIDAEDNYVGVVPFSGTNYWDDSVCQYINDLWDCTGNSNLKSEYAANGASYSGEPYPYVYRSNMSSTAPTFYTSGNAKYIQNNGYTIAYYVENYLNKLKSEKGLPSSATSRLLSYEEAKEFRNVAKYDVDIEQCNAGVTQIAMQADSMDEATAAQAATVLCNGGDLDGSTLSSILNDGSITSEYYSLLGLTNVELVGSELYNSTFWLGSATGDGVGVCRVYSDGDVNDNGFYDGSDGGVRPVIVVSTSDIGA